MSVIVNPQFVIQCPTCLAYLKVTSAKAAGAILACPKCGSMVPIPELPQGRAEAEKTSSAPSSTGKTETQPKSDEAHAGEGQTLPEYLAEGRDRQEASRGGPADEQVENLGAPGGYQRGVSSTPVAQSVESSEASPEIPGASLDVASRYKFLRIAVAVAVGVIGILAVWVFYVRERTHATREPVAEKDTGTNVTENLSPVSAPQSFAEEDRLWVMKDAGFCLRQNLSARFTGSLAGVFAKVFSLEGCSAFINQALTALGLKWDVIRAMTVFGDQHLTPAVLVVDLKEEQHADPLNVLGQPWQKIGEFNLRKIPATQGLVFTVVGERRVVIGREDSVRQLFAGNQPPPNMDIWEESLKDNIPCLLMIRGTARDNRSPVWWFDPWPELAEAWRGVWASTDVFIASVELGEEQTTCSLQWIAKDFQEKNLLEKNLRSLLETATQHCEARVAAASAHQAATADPDPKRELNRRHYEFALSVLKAAQIHVSDGSVRITCELRGQQELDSLLEKLVNAITHEWQQMAETAWDARHRRLGAAIGEYEKGHQMFPMAAGGGTLLPPETRVSWIANMLPYLDHEDWAKSLHVGYSWNSNQNRSVTQRYLPAVTNPLLGPTQTIKGYYDSHFAGITGIGNDSAELPATHPRAGIFNYRNPIRTSDIKDGLSNTIAILGVEKELGPWAAGGRATTRALTTPPYVSGPDGFGSAMPGGMLATMADGAVRFVRKDIDPRVLEQLATIAGGEPVTADLLQPKPPLPGSDLAQPKKPDQSASDSTSPPGPNEILTAHVWPIPSGPDTEVSAQPISLRRRLAHVQFQSSFALALALFSQWSGVPLAIDPESAEWLHISGQEHIQIEMKEATFEDLARNIAEQVGLAVVPCGQTVVLVSPERMSNRVHYKVSAEGTQSGIRFSHETLQQVCDWLNKMAATVPENVTSIRRGENGVVVEGPFPVVFEIQRLLENPLGSDQAKGGGDDGQTTVSLNFFEPARLIDVVITINRMSESQVFFDWPSLSQNDVTPDTDVSISASDEPLPEVLARLAQSIQAEVHRLSSGAYLVCASKRFFPSTLRFYPAENLLSRGATPGQLREQLVKECASESWVDGGGQGMLLYDVSARGFVVLNNLRAHQELRAWFEKQRQADRGQ
ncbi:MAG: DUF1559 family PulG-like putative transporter [Thermogutta sp.]